MRLKSAVVAACLALLASAGSSLSAPESCASLYDEIKSSNEQHTVDQLKAFYLRSLATGDCTDAFKKALGRRVAVAIVRSVDAAVAAGTPTANQEGALTESLRFHRLWQVLAVLGDIASDRQDFIGAASRYQQSLEALSNRELTRSQPADTTIRTMFKKAETARLLAPRYVPAPKNSAGASTGLGAADIRGYVPDRVSVPISFGPDTAELDPEGQRALLAMIGDLSQQGSSSILLVGHVASSDTGGDTDLLSEQRAQTVRRIMIDAGYRGAIQIQGLGARQPFDPDDPSRYTEEQRNRMNSRVELHR